MLIILAQAVLKTIELSGFREDFPETIPKSSFLLERFS
jgi:hypothetical protein